MGKSYVTIEDVAPYGWQVSEEDKMFFDTLRERASRLFEILCYVPEDFFQPGTDTLESRTFYGTNSVYLDLPPFYDLTEVTMPSGYTVPHYINEDGFLRTTDQFGVVFEPMYINRAVWYSGVPVTVRAKWGFKAIPEDVKHAVCELVIAIWRTKDTAFLKAVNLESNQVIVNAIPERTKLVANYYNSRKNIPAFV